MFRKDKLTNLLLWCFSPWDPLKEMATAKASLQTLALNPMYTVILMSMIDIKGYPCSSIPPQKINPFFPHIETYFCWQFWWTIIGISIKVIFLWFTEPFYTVGTKKKLQNFQCVFTGHSTTLTVECSTIWPHCYVFKSITKNQAAWENGAMTISNMET